MSDIAIKVENISKAYRIGLKEQRHDTLGATMAAWVKSPLRNFKKLKSLSNFTNQNDEDIFWALQDINFEVKKGEVLGIIGKNGAGKSTLLKILSRITEPTTGRIEIYGRVASLLEVGTGFNLELTGRENVYLNGTILGMTKKEIDTKFDEIIDFSGVKKFLDTPVKRYSSGMKVRLAFAVAAHLDPEILVIDEVLAVGDAEFQKKCMGKMGELSKGQGRTVLFVSHNMAAVKSLCNRGIVLEQGKVKFIGEMDEVLNVYNSESANAVSNVKWNLEKAPGNSNAKITSIKLKSKADFFYIEKDIELEVEYVNLSDDHVVNISVSIFDNNDVYVLSSPNLNRIPLKKGKYTSVCTIPKDLLNSGKYFFTILLVGNNFEIITQLDKIVVMDVQEEGTRRGNYFGKWNGIVRPYLKWDNTLIES